MLTAGRYEPSALDLSGSEYVVEQTGRDENLRPEYEASDVAGNTIFGCTYEMYQAEDEFSFVDADGDDLFSVRASDTVDIAGEYLLVDDHTGKSVVVLDNDLSLFRDSWRIRDPDDGSLLAALDSRGTLLTVARTLLPLGGWIGHEYEISDATGDPVGSIESGFSGFDRYEVTINDTSSVPAVPVVVGTVVVDAIQAN